MTKTHRSFPDPSSVPHFSFNISYYSTQISMGSATKTSTRDTPQVSSSAGFNSTSSSKPELQNKNSSLQTFMQKLITLLLLPPRIPRLFEMSQFQKVNIKGLIFYLFCFLPLYFASCSLELQVYMIYG
jgi:hypothetical protein